MLQTGLCFQKTSLLPVVDSLEGKVHTNSTFQLADVRQDVINTWGFMASWLHCTQLACDEIDTALASGELGLSTSATATSLSTCIYFCLAGQELTFDFLKEFPFSLIVPGFSVCGALAFLAVGSTFLTMLIHGPRAALSTVVILVVCGTGLW